MTRILDRPLAEDVGAALRASAQDVERERPGFWTFALGAGAGLAAARLCDEWLLMEARLGLDPHVSRLSPGRLWRLLGWNALLRGGAKFVLETDGAVGLRVEVPVDDGTDVAGRVHQACLGLGQAAALYRTNGAKGEQVEPGPEQAEGEPAVDLRPLCTQAGWPCGERADGTLTVELEVPGGFRQAVVGAEPNGATLLWAEVAQGDGRSRSPDCSRALALLLLSACRTIRMARASAPGADQDGARVVRFEVSLDTPPCAGEMAHALASLSVACRRCAREAAVLQQEGLAAQYLALRGRSS